MNKVEKIKKINDLIMDWIKEVQVISVNLISLNIYHVAFIKGKTVYIISNYPGMMLGVNLKGEVLQDKYNDLLKKIDKDMKFQIVENYANDMIFVDNFDEYLLKHSEDFVDIDIEDNIKA